MYNKFFESYLEFYLFLYIYIFKNLRYKPSFCIEVLYIYYIYAEFHRLHLINSFTYLQGVS